MKYPIVKEMNKTFYFLSYIVYNLYDAQASIVWKRRRVSLLRLPNLPVTFDAQVVLKITGTYIGISATLYYIPLQILF